MTTPGSPCGSRAVVAASGERGVDHVQRGRPALGVARRRAVGQRPVLLRQAARLRGAVRAAPARRRGATVHRPALPPPDHRQGRTVPTDPQEVAAPPDRSPPTSPSCKPSSTSSVASTTIERPHQGIGRVTPIEPLAGHPVAQPARRRRPRPDLAAPTQPQSSSTTASPSSTTSPSTSAPNGPAATPPSSSTASTPPCSSTANSSATYASTRPAATSPPDDAAADHADPATYPPDCHPCPATYVSPMFRDRTETPSPIPGSACPRSDVAHDP